MVDLEGPGWRLVKDLSRKSFPFLIGGNGWAIELSEQEYSSLARFLIDLVEEHKQLANQLLPEETICLEKERTPWWGCLAGDKEQWSLQLILKDETQLVRNAEVFWPIPEAQSFALAIKKMWESY